MRRLDDANTVIDQITAELADENFLVCTEGKERCEVGGIEGVSARRSVRK